MITLAAWTLMKEGWELTAGGVAARLGALVVTYLAFSLMQRFLARNTVFRSVSVQLNLLALVLLVLLLMGSVFSQMNPDVRTAFRAAGVFLAITVALKIFDVLFFERLAQWRKKPPVPLVLRDLGRLGIALLALVLIIRGFFPGINLNVLAVSSLVVGYIVGNATQDTLGNLFAGLALNTERPFQLGDWVTVGGHTGMVVDTTWRATRLRTKAEDYIVIPNSSIAKESIVNFSRPTGIHGCYLTIGVSYETPPNKARAAILAVLREAEGVCKSPAPSVYLANYGNFSIDFKVKFFIEDFARLDPIQSGVLDRIWYAFRRERISIPFPIQEERFVDLAVEEKSRRATEQNSVRQLLEGVQLFKSLSPDEMNRLVTGATLMQYAQGENIVRQGDAGDSFFIIRQGRVEVLINGGAGQLVRVAQLPAGAIFGEMSLLTGEPRSATIRAETDVEVLCVSKEVFAGLLKADADLAGKLAAVLEKRAAETNSIASASRAAGGAVTTEVPLVSRIRKFFGLD